MLFSSLIFVYIFLAALLLLYFIPTKGLTYKNIILVIFSLLFYSFGEPIYIALMIAVVFVNYAFGLACATDGMSEPEPFQKVCLILSVVVNLGLLGIFKYTDFFIGNLNNIFGLSVKTLGLALPIGISFFTFQAMSYVIDVYRGVTEKQNSFYKLLLYVSFFPQLIAGPIVRYQDIADQLDNRKSTVEGVNDGIFRFSVGVAKKAVLADMCYSAANGLLSVSTGTFVLGTWMGALFYTLEIYFDFSGYSDMAIGLGKIFGFTFPENFNYPYISKNATEFWRRWHISLGTWFKDYLFYPLLKAKWVRNLTKKLSKSGHKKLSKTLPTVPALFVVWFCTGFWHGASWNFVLWGLYYFVLLVLEMLVLDAFVAKLPKVIGEILSRIYFIFVTIFGMAIFYFENNTFANLGYLFGIGTDGFTDMFTNSLIMGNIILLGVCIVLSCPIIPKLYSLIKAKTGFGETTDRIIKTAAAVLLLSAATVKMVGNTYSPFLYFRF